jgi:hypothetical protein
VDVNVELCVPHVRKSDGLSLMLRAALGVSVKLTLVVEVCTPLSENDFDELHARATDALGDVLALEGPGDTVRLEEAVRFELAVTDEVLLALFATRCVFVKFPFVVESDTLFENDFDELHARVTDALGDVLALEGPGDPVRLEEAVRFELAVRTKLAVRLKLTVRLEEAVRTALAVTDAVLLALFATMCVCVKFPFVVESPVRNAMSTTVIHVTVA